MIRAGVAVGGGVGIAGAVVVLFYSVVAVVGVGAVEGANAGYYATNGRYDVFPMLVVGDNSGSQQQNGIAVCADALGVGWLTFRKATGSAISDVIGGFSYSFSSDILGFRTNGEQRMFL